MIDKNNIKIAYLSILFTLSFCVYSYGADGFEPSDWDNKYTETGAPVHLDNKNYGSPNYFNLHIFAPKINPDWDPTDPSSPMWVYGPGSFYFDMSSFADDTTISSNGGGVGYHVANSTFNGSTSVDNIVYTGGDMMTVDNSSFNDDTYVLTAESRATSGDVGTQINESTFNDNTTFSVADGGVLELNNSVINLANEDLMQPLYTALDSIFESVVKIYYCIRDYSDPSGLVTAVYPISGNTFTVALPSYTFSKVVYNNFNLDLITVSGYAGFCSQIRLLFRDVLPTYITAPFMFLYDVFYPLNPDSFSWQYYNTDTGKMESTNLGGLMYNISWYLGELYKTNDWEAAQGFKDAQDTIDNLTEDMSSAESAITDTVLPNIQDFSPDPSDVASLSGLSFVGSFIQDFYLALGVFGIPVMLSLVLAVCMQLIGYFKYKR